MRLESGARQLFRLLLSVLNSVATLALLGIMILTFIDVFARYVFNSPLHGGTVITEILLVCLIFIGLPLATLRDEHISIDLFDRWVPAALAPLQRRLVFLLCGIFAVLLGWRMYLKAAYVAGTGETTASLGLPAAAIIYPMAVLIVVMAIVFLTKAIFPGISERAGSDQAS